MTVRRIATLIRSIRMTVGIFICSISVTVGTLIRSISVTVGALVCSIPVIVGTFHLCQCWQLIRSISVTVGVLICSISVTVGFLICSIPVIVGTFETAVALYFDVLFLFHRARGIVVRQLRAGDTFKQLRVDSTQRSSRRSRRTIILHAWNMWVYGV